MNMIKIALASTVTIGLLIVGTANAEPIRSGAATYSNVVIKKSKLTRSVAPSTRESKEMEGTNVALGLAAAVISGFGLYEATKGNKNDSPAG